MSRYKVKIDGGIINTETGAIIPNLIVNRDWREYIKWLEEGNVPDPEYSFDDIKSAKKRAISRSFDDAMASGSVVTVRSIRMDARRSASKNDLQNMEALSKFMFANSMATTAIIDATNTEHSDITISEIDQIAADIRAFGIMLFAKKSGINKIIDAATTTAEIEAITW